MFIYVILILLVASRTQSDESRFCPSECTCYGQSIVCKTRSLNKIPKLPHFLPDQDGGAFEYFLMSRTNLSNVLKESFVGYKDLTYIDLSSNEIQFVSENAFVDIPKLTFLSLRQNRLKSLPDSVFKKLFNLENLDLSMNRLTELPVSIESMINLKVLTIKGNPLLCPCQIVNVAVLLIHLEGPGGQVTCEGPAVVRGKSLVELGKRYSAAFNGTNHLGFLPDDAKYKYKIRDRTHIQWPMPHCSENDLGGTFPAESVDLKGNSIPVFETTPTSVFVAEGEKAYFICVARGWPIPKISWTIPTNQTSFVRLWNRRRILELSEVHSYHKGTFTCNAENLLSRISHSVSLQVVPIVKPKIVQAPPAKTLVGSVGSDLELVCSAVGRPRPSISWMYRHDTSNRRISTEGRYIIRQNSQINAKSLEERIRENSRKNVLNDDGEMETLILFIKNATERDFIGRYTCYASNRAGSARVSSVLKVSQLQKNIPNIRKEEPAVIPEHIDEDETNINTDNTEDLVKRVIDKARKRIDAAIQKTADNLRDPGSRRSSSDIASLFRQPSKAAVELSKAAEVYEAALDEVTQILKQRQENIGKNDREIYRGDEDFDEQKRAAFGVQITAEQLAIIAQLSGCARSQRVEPCDHQLCYHLRYRSIDGGCNNLKYPRWGAALSPFYRLLPPVYENGVNTPVGWSPGKLYYGFPKPSARLVSYSLLANATKLKMHTETLKLFNEEIRLLGLANVSKIQTKKPLQIEFVHKRQLFDEDDVSSGMLMQWGQFVDHDLDFTPVDASTSRFSDGLGCNETCINDPPCFPIIIPPGDPRIHHRCIGFARSSATCGSGSTSILLGQPQHREQLNQITSFIDASNVYGSEDFESRQLRDTLYDEGKLREGMPTPSGKRLLPFNIRGQVDCQADPGQDFVPCFKAGDHRNNEQLGLISMHTLWMREHNRIADELRSLNNHWSGDKIYQESRKIVAACMQSITYRQWLPRILSKKTMSDLEKSYTGYDSLVNPTISNEFATAAFRFGHTLVAPFIFRLNENWETIPEGHLLLHKAFFAPDRMLTDGGLDPILRGLLFHGVRDIFRKPSLNPELTERLFAMAHQLALDLASLNIQRGRDHGLQHYTAYAFTFCGLGSSAEPDSFDDLSDRIKDVNVRERLRSVYGHPANIDLFVGGVLEDVLPGARVGPTFDCIIADQFKRVRAGDRLWHEVPGVFSIAQLAEIRDSGSSLARVVCENGDNITDVPMDAFKRPKNRMDLVKCSKVPKLNLAMWKDCPSASGTQFGSFEDTGISNNEQEINRFRRNTRKTECYSELVEDDKENDFIFNMDEEREQRKNIEEYNLKRRNTVSKNDD